ncbi:MAG: glutamine--fructose-6-phosphate transaminase (isomerizing) [Methanobacteriota archaeon]|nr:MAG: glutamine--fructose-6-phosphate transaminase (isomerizing) [Euryarchaeota archaeon]
MCGIIGITQHTCENTGKMVYEALTRLEYRGYDSVGMAIIDPQNNLVVQKDKGSIEEVGQKLDFSSYMGYTAIGHSRWATHGPPSQKNAHPHVSQHKRVAVVHNGIIENFLELKKDLMDLGYNFVSDTDTEVIPHLMEYFLSQGMSPLEGIRELVKTIKGTFAIVMTIIDEPDTIYAFRRDNPLVLGIGENENFCASDIPAFLPYTNKVIILKDDELAILKPDSYKIIDLKSGDVLPRKPKEINWTAEAAQKGGFPHFMLKEIHEQPKVLRTQLATQEDQLEEVADKILAAEKILVVAAGTAYYAALPAYYLFPQLAKKVVVPVISAEWDAVSPIIDEKTVVIASSQSGETLDTIRAVKDAISRKATIIAVVNVVDSTLTRYADHVIYIHTGPEIGVAATKTYSGLNLAINRIAYHVALKSGALNDEELQEFEQAIQNLPDTIEQVIMEHEIRAKELSNWLKQKSSAFYLGRGPSLPTACEGALKMKEIAYLHAEAYPAGESKHGPIALIENDFPVIFTIPNDSTRRKMMGSVQEMKARGAKTIGIIEEGDEEIKQVLDHYFEIPKGYSKYLSSIVYEIPQQMLAYYTATLKGLNPDKPRNLSKSVTVE